LFIATGNACLFHRSLQLETMQRSSPVSQVKSGCDGAIFPAFRDVSYQLSEY
jgi:hypothetical protein